MARSLRYLFVLLLVGISGAAYAQLGEIRGTITDKLTKDVIIGARVVVTQGGITMGGAVTDYNGEYSVKPLTAASNYVVTITYTQGNMKKVVLEGVIVSPNTATKIDRAMETIQGTEVVITAPYEPPMLANTGGPTGNIDGKTIKNLTTRNTSDIAATQVGVYQSKSGANVSIGGARSEGTLYVIDGIQVTGSRSINQTPGLIDQMQVITSGIPARYGDASGGVINITTRGISSQYVGGVSYEHSVDGYNTNLASFNISGPFLSRKTEIGKKPIVGFVLAGDYRFDKDNDPTYYKNYVLKDEVLQRLQQNPLVASQNPNGTTTFKPATEYVTKNDMKMEKARDNASLQRASLTGKLNYEITPGTNLTAGGSFFYNRTYNYDRGLSVFAPDAIGLGTSYTGRGYLRFTQRFGGKTIPAEGGEAKAEKTGITNAFYSVQADFQRDHSNTEDPNHKKNTFEYGYVGKFQENYQPVYGPGVDDSIGKFGIKLLGYTPTGVSFQRSEINPLLANYTSSYYALGGAAPSLLSNTQSGVYLRNGDGPNSVYSLWSNVGTPRGGYSYQQADQFSIGVDASFDYKAKRVTHSVEFGLYYQQRSERFYGVSGSGIWGLMRLLTHRVVPFTELDNTNPIYLVGGQQYSYQDIRNGVVAFGPNDTILYNRVYNASAAATNGFDYNIRKKLGLGARDYVQPDAYDPSTYSLDMFTPDELLNQGNSLVSYYGYDYTGKILNGQVNFNDFWTKKENGVYTRPIGAYRPNYIAGYISDNIRFKEILFNIGVRIERFDNNTKVLKDPYSLYATNNVAYTEGLANGAKNLLNGGTTPSNISKDAVVYVNDNSSSSPSIIGYRNGETWYDPYGREVADPSVLKNYSGGRDPQPYLNEPNGAKITDTAFAPDKTFTDYKPQVNAMPRISFSFPVNTGMFYAHYDVIIQRPKPGLNGVLTGVGAYASPVDYYYLTQNSNGIIGNPNLKPEKTVNYEVGFQQQLTKNTAVTINAFYKERRDQIQVRPYIYAWPITYYTYGNRDFSNTKGLGIKYEMRRSKTSNLSMTLAYTLQFAEGTGSSTSSGNGGSASGVAAGGLLQYLVSAQLPNLMFTNALDYDSRHIISASVDYRYGQAQGPQIGKTYIFQNAGINFLFQTRSGEPYTSLAQAQTLQSGVNNANVIIGNINTSRLPWHYMLNAKVDKDFMLDFSKKREDGTTKGKIFYLNAYVFIQNLLNTRDVLSVYRYTGQPNDDGFLTSASGAVTTANQTNAQSFQDLYSIKMQDPSKFNNPRRIIIGLSFNF